MEVILRHPTIKSFLLGINRQDHVPMLKQLVLIGIDTVLAKFKGTTPQELKSTLLAWTKPQKSVKVPKTEGTIVKQIQEIKEELLKIHEKFEFVGGSQYETTKEEPKDMPLTTAIAHPIISTHQSVSNEHSRNDNERRKPVITPKVTEVYPEQEWIEPQRKPDKRCLDDTQSRLALTYYTAEEERRPKANAKTNVCQSETAPPQLDRDVLASQPDPSALRMRTYETATSAIMRTDTEPYRATAVKKSKSKSPRNIKTKQQSTKYNTSHSQKALQVEPKYLRKVESRIKDLIREDKQRSKLDRSRRKSTQEEQIIRHQKENIGDHNNRPDCDFTLPAEQRQRNFNRFELENSDESLSPYKHQESNIAIANRFLSSELVQQFSESNLSDSEQLSVEQQLKEQSKEDDSQFSMYSPNFTEINESAASFRQPSYHRKNKEVGKISRRRE